MIHNNKVILSIALLVMVSAFFLSFACSPAPYRMKRAERLYRQGQIYHARGDQEKAIKKFEESIALSEMVDFKPGIANNLNEMAIIHTRNQAFAKARDLLHQCLDIYKELNMASEVSKTLNNIALSYEQEGDFPKAIATYEELLAWDKETDNHIGMGLTASRIGYLYSRKLNDKDKAHSKFMESIPYFEQAIEAFWETGTTSGMAKALHNLGFVYERYLGNQEEALLKYEEALPLARESQSKGLAAAVLDDIAAIHASRRQFEKAGEALIESARLYQELQMVTQASRALKNAALACVMNNDYQAAITQYEASVQWHKKIKDDLGAAVALNSLGLLYKDHLNRPEDANEKFTEALQILRKLGNETYIRIVEKNLTPEHPS